MKSTYYSHFLTNSLCWYQFCLASALFSLFLAITCNAPCFVFLVSFLFSFSISSTFLANLSDYALPLIAFILMSTFLGSPNANVPLMTVSIPFLWLPVSVPKLNGFDCFFGSFSWSSLSLAMLTCLNSSSFSLIYWSFSRSSFSCFYMSLSYSVTRALGFTF